VKKLGERFKVFGLVALLGFMAGVIADVTSEHVIPWLVTVLPVFLNTRYILSGLAGACLTLVLVSIWAYIAGPSEP
jgi:threonine/homoserine/homoserine lactone efflux protein